MPFLARLIFFQNFPRDNPEYIIRTRPEYKFRTASVHKTEAVLPDFVVFINVFSINQDISMYKRQFT